MKIQTHLAMAAVVISFCTTALAEVMTVCLDLVPRVCHEEEYDPQMPEGGYRVHDTVTVGSRKYDRTQVPEAQSGTVWRDIGPDEFNGGRRYRLDKIQYAAGDRFSVGYRLQGPDWFTDEYYTSLSGEKLASAMKKSVSETKLILDAPLPQLAPDLKWVREKRVGSVITYVVLYR